MTESEKRKSIIKMVDNGHIDISDHELGGIGAELLEQIKKDCGYKARGWHDLRKDPNDLPIESFFYIVAIDDECLCSHFKYYIGILNYSPYSGFEGEFGDSVVAWKHIEPLEEVE